MQTDPIRSTKINLPIDRKNLLNSFFDTSPLMMGIIDLEQNEIRHIMDNQASAEFFGRSVEEMEGRLSSEIGMPPEIIRMWNSYYRIAEATQGPVNFQYSVGKRALSATVNFIGKTEFGASRFSYVVSDVTEVKKSEITLEGKIHQRTAEVESLKAQMTAIFEAVSDGIMVFDNHQNVVLINEAMAQILGFESLKELETHLDFFQKLFELKNMDDSVLPLDQWPISRILRGESLKDLELKVRRLDVNRTWYFRYSGGPVFDGQGEQLYSVCITKDITPHKLAEKAQGSARKNLANSESRYRYLFVNNPLPMFVYDKDSSQFLDVNQSALVFYGYTREEFLNLSLNQIRPYQNNAHFKKNGELASVEIHGHDMDYQGKRAKLVLVNDVTQREQVERNLKETVEQLEFALKNVSDYKFALDQASILATTDARGVITFVNEKFCEISQYSRDELIGRTHRVVNSGYHSKEFFKEFWDTITSGKVWKGEICNKAKDGSIYWVDTVIVPFLDLNGRPYQYVAVRNDITDRKSYQSALEAAINSRDEFLSIASHELKTPLTSLKLNTQMAMRHKDKIERFPRYLEQTNKQVQRLAILVEDMLDISRIDMGKFSIQKAELDLVKVIYDVMEKVHEVMVQAGCTIKAQLPDSCFGIWDKFRIEQVIINLLTNAAKYGPGKPVELTLAYDSEEALLIIRDYGIGIAEEDQKRIFQRFERAVSPNEVSGLGLGLYISSEIIKMHHGKIEVLSKINEGSTFKVHLPLTHH